MKNVLSVDNMRRSDAATIGAGTPGTELMMRAAKGIFSLSEEACTEVSGIYRRGPVAIVCGSGNNAGDGYALALLLQDAAVDCTIFCASEKFSDDGGYYYDKCVDAGIKIEKVSGGKVSFEGYAVIVDALLGTGFSGDVRQELKSVIEAINESSAYVVSVDINSGLNGNTGMGQTIVRSDMTVSVGGFKPGHFLNMAKDVMKGKINRDIGIEPVDEPYRLLESEDVRKILGSRPEYSNKGTYGYTALIGGSTRYSGAIRLAYLANAAMRSGAGVVKAAVPSSIVHDVAGHILESTIFPLSCTGPAEVMSTNSTGTGLESEDGSGNGNACFREDSQVVYVPEEIDELISNVRTVAFGMGVGTGEGAKLILEHLLTEFDGTLIVDADGLTLLSHMNKEKIRTAGCRLVLTPHIKEFSRLTGMEITKILEDPIGNAVNYAADVNAVVLLKGPSTVITDGDRVYLTDRGCAGMATAGSGDVLSGIAAAVCSYTEDKCLAAAAAAYINGAAGEAAQEKNGVIGMTAGDTAAAIPQAILF